MLYEKIGQLSAERSSKIDQKQLGELSQTINQTKEDIVRENTQFVISEVKNLEDLNTTAKSILEKLDANKKKCEQTIFSLETQVSQLDKKVNDYIKEINANNVEDELRNRNKILNDQYIKVCKERINQARSIDIKELDKIEIDDRKSLATQVFKWILVSMYMETQSKFYWPNFKKQAFEKDKGADFIQRLGKVRAMETKEEQRIKTEWFLENYPKIIQAPELSVAKKEIAKIQKVAEGFKQGYHISQQIQENEEKIKKHKETTLEKDEESMRWKARSGALSDRIKINKQYLEVIKQAENKLKPRLTVYAQKIEGGKKIQEDFQQLNQWKPTIQIKTQNENCQCSIF